METFHNVGGKFVRAGQIIEVGKGTVFDPENIQTGFVAGKDFVNGETAEASIGIAFAPGFFAVMTVWRIVALDELLQIVKGHWGLFQRKVLIGPQIVEPHLFGLAIGTCRAFVVKENVCFNSGFIKDSGG